MEMPFGMRCAPSVRGRSQETPRVIGYHSIRTSLARASKQHCLEPRREVVHDGKVACRDEEVTDAHEHGYLLLQERGREHRFDCNAELEDDKRDEEQGREYHRDEYGGR